MQRKFLLFILVTTFLSFLVKGNKKKDIEAIKGMCGCMDIEFKFAETFSPNKDYKYYDNYTSGGRELALVVEETKDKIVIQHLLVVGGGMVIKHWRQDWIYQGVDILSYDKDERWKKKKLEKKDVKGKWIQKVYQVDDIPRYEGVGSWIHLDGKSYWESEADAPLPRREYTKRNDYNVLKRINRHEIKDVGWVHEQDNLKILRENSDKLIAEEKGKNTYKRVALKKCEDATNWWVKNEVFWELVRNNWDSYFEKNDVIAFKKSVNKQPMFSGLFAMGKKYEGLDENSTEMNLQNIRDEVNNHINKFSKE